MFRSLGRFAAVGVGVAASVGAAAVAVKAAGSEEAPAPAQPFPSPEANATIMRRFNFPDAGFPGAFNKWNFNWDGQGRQMQGLEPGVGGTIWPATPPTKDGGDFEDDDYSDCGCGCGPGDSLPTARRNIILVRHGQYNQDDLEEDSGHTLTPLWKEQAAFAGKRLAEMGVKFTSIISSSMIRAKQTACIILKNMPEQDQLKLEEILVEGARIEAGFRKYFYRADPSQEEDSWEIIVCHGNVIRYFSLRALQFPPEGWIRLSIDHCSITRITVLPSGEIICKGLGDSGHIPWDKATVV